MSRWIVYSRPGCGLCEEFLQQLAEHIGDRAAHVQVVDVDSDAELKRKYGQRIPVLAIDGEFVCAYRLDMDRLQFYLQAP